MVDSPSRTCWVIPVEVGQNAVVSFRKVVKKATIISVLMAFNQIRLSRNRTTGTLIL